MTRSFLVEDAGDLGHVLLKPAIEFRSFNTVIEGYQPRLLEKWNDEHPYLLVFQYRRTRDRSKLTRSVAVYH